jgi:hypothetical protein
MGEEAGRLQKPRSPHRSPGPSLRWAESAHAWAAPSLSSPDRAHGSRVFAQAREGIALSYFRRSLSNSCRALSREGSAQARDPCALSYPVSAQARDGTGNQRAVTAQ